MVMNKKLDNSQTEQDQPSFAADLLVTAWIVVVAVAYYGPVINPGLGRMATILAPAYALMVLLSVLSIALRFSNRRNERSGRAASNRKSGQVSR